MTRTEKLALLHNRRTTYEITATKDGEPSILIGYSPRLSRIGLLRAMQHVGARMIERLAIGDSDETAWHTKPHVHCTFTNGWTVGFTGRTHRDAIMSEELPFIGA